MIHVDAFVNCLHDSGVTFFAGVPDSLLKSFCAHVTDRCGESHVIAANEGGAVGWPAGNKQEYLFHRNLVGSEFVS